METVARDLKAEAIKHIVMFTEEIVLALQDKSHLYHVSHSTALPEGDDKLELVITPKLKATLIAAIAALKE